MRSLLGASRRLRHASVLALALFAGCGGDGGDPGIPPYERLDYSEAELLEQLRASLDAIGSEREAQLRAIFGFEADGAAGPDTVGALRWDPTHDSVYFQILDDERAMPLLVSNASEDGTPEGVTLAVYYEDEGRRAALFGGSPFRERSAPVEPADANFDALVARTIRHLAGGEPTKIVTSQLADSYWFRHDDGAEAFLTANFPAVYRNAEDACDGAALENCLKGASVLILGQALGDDDGGPQDEAAVLAALEEADELKIPVLYVQDDGSLSSLGEALLARFRLGASDNYWWKERIEDFTPSPAPAANAQLDALSRLVDTLIAQSLSVDDYASCVGAVSRFDSCDNAAYQDKLGEGLAALRTMLNGLDRLGMSVDGAPPLELLRRFVWLGDLYREGRGETPAIDYPVNVQADALGFMRAAFADSSVALVRTGAAAQADLGTFVCPRAEVLDGSCVAYDPADIATPNVERSERVEEVGRWTSTGAYALRGRGVEITRLDDSELELGVYIGFQRTGSTRSFEGTGAAGNYDRPQYLRSVRVPVPAGGSVTVASPYGGAIYLDVPGNSEAAGTELRVRIRGAGAHAALLDTTNADAVARFAASVADNPLPHVDLRGVGFEAHLRKDYFLDAVKGERTVLDGGGDSPPLTVNYEGKVSALMTDYATNFVESVYRLAAFSIPGKALSETLSSDVREVCAALGIDCADEALHRRSGVQHANYDQYANCGAGCSGNPFDAAWTLSPLGWGESHELGHNLQRGELNVNWVPEAGRDDWSMYAGRAGENSNNVFAYHTLYNYARRVRAYDGPLVEGHMNQLELFAILQSERAGLTAEVDGVTQRVIYDQSCNLRGSFPVDSAGNHASVIFEDGGYAVDNGLRMSFYLQLPLMLDQRVIAGDVTLDDGFDIFRLLYLEARNFARAAGDDERWLAERDALGFGLFPREGHAVYAGRSVGGIPGNDFMLVALSYISRLDMRPYFDSRGLRYSSLAAEQVEAHITSGAVTGPAPDAFYVLETDLPGADLSAVPTVALDGVAAWPRGGFHPSQCLSPAP